MKRETEEINQSANNLLRNAQIIFGLVILCAFVILFVYVKNFQQFELSKQTDVWGQVGDFFGGLLNPIIGIATIYLILISISIQRHELAFTRIEMKKTCEALEEQGNIAKLQSFEQTFFSWLSNFRNLVTTIEFNIQKIEPISNSHQFSNDIASFKKVINDIAYVKLSGLNAIAHLWNYEDSQTRYSSDIFEAISAFNEIDANVNRSIEDKQSQFDRSYNFIEQEIVEKWESFYLENGHQFDGMFRSFFGLISWIDRQKQLSEIDKLHYVHIILAQLSQLELHLLFFFGLSKQGCNYRPLCEKFALFDQLSKNDPVVNFHIKYCNKIQHGYKLEAFNNNITDVNTQTTT